jgi:hypothetical protein
MAILAKVAYAEGNKMGVDGPGMPPDIEVSIFSAGDFANGRDSALNMALELLAWKDK